MSASSCGTKNKKGEARVTQMTGKRLSRIDVMRGIAILLVVLGHSVGTLKDPVNRFVLSFHMPLFFFISGMVAKSGGSDGAVLPFGKYLLKKMRVLLIPQGTLFLLDTAFDIALEHKAVTAGLILENLFGWFLWVLFYVSIVFWLLDRTGLLKKRWISLLIALIPAVLTQIFPIKTVVHIETLPMALLFYLAGHYIRPAVEKDAPPRAKFRSIWVAALPIIVIISRANSPVTMYSNTYGDLVLFFAGAALGIWCVYEISAGLGDNAVLRWFGVNSVIVYIFHARMLNVLHGVGKAIFPALEKANYSYPAYFYYFLIVCVLFVPIVYISNHWVAFLFGKKNIRRKKGEAK